MSKHTVVKQEMTVQRVRPSAVRPWRWVLELSCGHEKWVTSKTQPQRIKATCDQCVTVVSI